MAKIDKEAKSDKVAETPMMKQFNEIKAKHPNAILLFRVGDFYETFCEDAEKTSKILGITLTKRANGVASSIALAGFPYHSLDTYMPRLVRAGERVAICEQLEDPKTTKKIVKRGVTEIITPGVSFNSDVILNKENNFIASIYFGKRNIGIAFMDVTTGEFLLAEGKENYIDKLLSNFAPKELIYQRGQKEHLCSCFGSRYFMSHLDEWIYSGNGGYNKLAEQLKVKSLKGFGIENSVDAIVAAGAILYYLDLTEHKNIEHINTISRIDEDKYVWLDKFTLNNLEIISPSNIDGKSLVDVIDTTVSPMGGRMIRRWLSLPLKNIKEINNRLSITKYLCENPILRELLRSNMREIGDIERLASKCATGKISPREVVQLACSLDAISQLQSSLTACDSLPLRNWSSEIKCCKSVSEAINKSILPEPSVNISKGGVIASNVNMELDDLRKLSVGGKEALLLIQERESEDTGIPSLKISFNNVFGYYIEVRNTHKDKVPERWTRKQTLVSAERYITEELKEYEEKILGAEEKILIIENSIYTALVAYISKHISDIQFNASIIAQIDTLCSFASLGEKEGYSLPKIDNSNNLTIKEGKHPIIESLLPLGQNYIPNDVILNNEDQQIIIVTGPNMSGKSAILRQTAIIVLMAQVGSYVPASSASIGIVDKIFTRVGASDNISQGESTFMVEMLESANILNNITDKSLVLLDEIGRGTSTYDGISIAWAMVEYLHQNSGKKAKTLFATHYHELNEMEDIYPRIKNYNVMVKEENNKVHFVRKLVKGGTAHSFGIHVAKMAGMPKFVLNRSAEILKLLEDRRNSGGEMGIEKVNANPIDKTFLKETCDSSGMQLSFFQLDDPLVSEIKSALTDLDINTLTPLDALNKLNELKRLMGI